MASITDIIVAEAERDRDAAVLALRSRNAEAPTDGEVLEQFISNHVASDGSPRPPVNVIGN